ncbi:MAG: DUF1328 domain-containing protein [Flavobacteriales bacterium]|nr:DUF1328 domain-containing protein [Flavobacteriales bacterium]
MSTLRWSLVFLVIALFAAVIGFGGSASGVASTAKVVFFIAMVLLLACLARGSAQQDR